jgi:hypothetical protein
MSQSFRSDLALLGLAVVGVLADLACVLTNHTPPQLFENVAIAGLTGAAGVALPFRTGNPNQAAPDAPASATYQASGAVSPYNGPVGQ